MLLVSEIIMVSSIGGNGSVAQVLQNQQQRVEKQQDEQRITDQRKESDQLVQEERRVQQTNDEQNKRQGSLVDVTV